MRSGLAHKERSQKCIILISGPYAVKHSFILIEGKQADKVREFRILDQQIQDAGIDLSGIQ